MKKYCSLILFAAYINTANAQHIYRNIILEGGGIKGFAFAGAMQVLDSIGLLKNIQRVGGTSAGAIQATMLAIGYTPAELIQKLDNIPLKDFNDGWVVGGLHRMKKKFGFFKGQKLNDWIRQLIAEKTGNVDITFLQLHNNRSVKNYKDLYITGTDLTYRCLRIFCYEDYPDMRIADALRISFSVPLYFQPVYINDNGQVLKDTSHQKFHLMVDGGLVANYPLKIFDKPYHVASDSTDSLGHNINTLGLLLDKPDQLNHTKDHEGNPLGVRNLRQYVGAVYHTIIDGPNPDDTNLKRTIVINDLGISGRVRKLQRSVIETLVENGREAMRTWFAN
jgi:NTE family protein